MPPPAVTTTALGAPDTLYAGLNLTLQCEVALLTVTGTHVEVSVEWRKNGWSFRNCPQTERLSPTEFRCTTKFTPLNYRRDNGTYSCAAVLSPRAQYTYLRTQTGPQVSNNIPVQVLGQCYSYRLSIYSLIHISKALCIAYSPCSDCYHDNKHHSDTGCVSIQHTLCHLLCHSGGHWTGGEGAAEEEVAVEEKRSGRWFISASQ